MQSSLQGSLGNMDSSFASSQSPHGSLGWRARAPTCRACHSSILGRRSVSSGSTAVVLMNRAGLGRCGEVRTLIPMFPLFPSEPCYLGQQPLGGASEFFILESRPQRGLCPGSSLVRKAMGCPSRVSCPLVTVAGPQGTKQPFMWKQQRQRKFRKGDWWWGEWGDCLGELNHIKKVRILAEAVLPFSSCQLCLALSLPVVFLDCAHPLFFHVSVRGRKAGERQQVGSVGQAGPGG